MIAIVSPVNQQVLDKPEIRLSGKVVDDRGIAEVKIEVNGVPFKTGIGIKTRDLRIEGTGGSPVGLFREGREVILNEQIHLNAGENSIRVTAIDVSGLSQTETIRVTYVPEQGEVWAAVIGISKYQRVEGLRYADRDAEAFYDYLVNDNNIPKDHVILLMNEDATLQKIKDVLGVDIKQRARKEDTVIIYYAGHGAPEPDRNSPDDDKLEKYLLPYDADPKRLYSTALPMEEISKIFSRLSAERIVLLQDTCYSGSSGGGGRTVQTSMTRASVSDAYLDRLTKGEGRVIITASEANEVSIERDDLRHGVFTYYLLEALSKGDTDGDGIITVGEAYRYVSKKVPDATGQNQHPVKRGEERKGEITLGKVRKQ